jgi:hypothetical protein
MAIHTSFLGITTISGDEAKAFNRKVTHAQGTKAAAQSARSGLKMMTSFQEKGVVVVKLVEKKLQTA